jgi:hypothetical protein
MEDSKEVTPVLVLDRRRRARVTLILWILGSIIVIFFFFIPIGSAPILYGFSAILFVIAAVLALGILRQKRIEFYNDHVVISGGGTTKSLNYSQVQVGGIDHLTGKNYSIRYFTFSARKTNENSTATKNENRLMRVIRGNSKMEWDLEDIYLPNSGIRLHDWLADMAL